MQGIPMTREDLAAFAKSADMLARFAEMAKQAESADQVAEAQRAEGLGVVLTMMAEDMREIAGAMGSCTIEDLVLKGWRREAIIAHREAANRYALALAGDGRMDVDGHA